MVANEFSTLSLIVPCLNEEENLEEIYTRIGSAVESLSLQCELLFVDDGSTDRTWEVIQNLQRRISKGLSVRGIRFARNFGQQHALLAGLKRSTGDIVVTLDADLQDPPEVLPELIDQCRQGAYVVYGVRAKRRHDPILKKMFATLFYRVIRNATGLDIPANAGEFRLARREVVDAVLKMREGRPFLRGMFAWVGFTRAYVQYERPERFAGEPKFTFRSSLQLALDAFVSFSELREQILFLLGGAGIAAAILSVIFWLFIPAFHSVIPFLLLVLVLLVAFQQLTMSLLGRDNTFHLSRPPYIVQEEVG